MSAVCSIQESIWLKRLQNELIPSALKTMDIFCDNKSAICIAINNSYSARTKHVDIKAKFIQEKITNGEITLKYINSDNMLADALTKAVNAHKINLFLNEIGLI